MQTSTDENPACSADTSEALFTRVRLRSKQGERSAIETEDHDAMDHSADQPAAESTESVYGKIPPKDQVEPSTSQDVDTFSTASPEKQKRLENILNRLITTQDEDKPNAACSISEPKLQNTSVLRDILRRPVSSARLNTGHGSQYVDSSRRKPRHTQQECSRKTNKTVLSSHDLDEKQVGDRNLERDFAQIVSFLQNYNNCNVLGTEKVDSNKSDGYLNEVSSDRLGLELAKASSSQSLSEKTLLLEAEANPASSASQSLPEGCLLTEAEASSSLLPQAHVSSWTCFVCNVSFSSGDALLSHLESHEGIEKYPCGKCTKVCSTIEELGLHIDKHLAENFDSLNTHHCGVCGETFSSELLLARHVSDVHESSQDGEQSSSSIVQEKSNQKSTVMQDETVDHSFIAPEYHKCSRCRRRFASEEALQLHKCQRGQVKPFGCGRCGRCFTQFSNLKEHAATHDEEPGQELECFECGQRFQYSIDLRRHVTVHIKADLARGREPGSRPTFSPLAAIRRTKKGKLRKRFQDVDENQCRVCFEFFPQHRYLKLHMQTHDVKRFSCEHCNKTFTFKKSLEIHTRSHTGDRPYQCSLCPQRFSRQDALQKHHKNHLGLRPHQCEQCGKQFADRFELRRHTASHSQQKPYKCEVCGKAYTEKARLKEHMFQHTGNLPYNCEQCGKGFARKYRYNLHMSHHAGEKKFYCEQCGKGFLRRSDYNNHKLTHTEDRPFKCDQCGLAFLRQNYLRRHQLVHSGEKPWTCHICFKDFKRKNALNRHMLSHDQKSDDISLDNYKYPAEFPRSRTNSVSHTSDVSQTLESSGQEVTGSEVSGTGKERDIMQDIQAVIGVSVASIFNEVM